MAVKHELLQKVPPRVKEDPHFIALLDYIKKNGIQTKEHLGEFLKNEIAATEQWLEEHRKTKTTPTRDLRNKVTHHDVLKKCHHTTQEFLF